MSDWTWEYVPDATNIVGCRSQGGVALGKAGGY
jgi:hypothetical protein